MFYFTTQLLRDDVEIEIQVCYSVEKASFENGFSGELCIQSVKPVSADITKRERLAATLFAICAPEFETTAEENRQIRDDANAHFGRRRLGY